VEGAFQRFSERSVDLGEPVTRFGREVADELIGTIETLGELANRFPVLIPGAGFIAGSLGRRTQEQPLDDVDIYLAMSAPGVRPSNNGVLLPFRAHSSSTTSPLVADPTLQVGNYISADAVLNRVAAYLAHWYPGDETGKGTRQKTCYVRRGGVNVDLTPVVWYSAEDVGIDQYWMPAGGGQVHWKPTNPKEDQRLLTAANQAHDGELLKVVRMMKWWNARRNYDRLKGIHLETIIVRQLVGKRLDGWANTLHYLFDTLRTSVMGPCPDPTGLGAPLDSTLQNPDRAISWTVLDTAYAQACAAMQAAERGDNGMCLRWWRAVFPLDV
jgi:hypothetical protein